MPEQIVEEPKLKEAAITQFVIDDGWIGLALGPRPTVARSPLLRRSSAGREERTEVDTKPIDR